MLRLPLKYQVALAPALIIVLLVALIGFTQSQLNAIRIENEAVREWSRVVERVRSAHQGAVNLDQLAGYIEWTRRTDAGNLAALEDFHFRYLDQYQQVIEDLDYRGIVTRVSPETLAFIGARQEEIRYREPLDTDQSRIALAELIPRLESVQSSFMAQKRYAYTEYYRNVNAITSRLGSVALGALGLCVLIGTIASAWTVRVTRARLRALMHQAGAVCDATERMRGPALVRDELDHVASCMRSMTQRLVDVVGAEKLLEGAEEERRRIAMDMHDQTLADITGLARELRALESADLPPEALRARLGSLERDLQELATGIRRVIDDLHPQTLEMLGLEPALRSYLEKRLSGPERPAFFLNIDPAVNPRLSEFERLNLYRIVLEAAHNVVRHAQASRYEIDCRQVDDTLVLTVEDNGVSMDYQQSLAKGGRGLSNIEQRARAIGASVTWGRSRFSSGTRLELRLALGARLTLPAQDTAPGQRYA